jgi:hypothetical protein
MNICIHIYVLFEGYVNDYSYIHIQVLHQMADDSLVDGAPSNPLSDTNIDLAVSLVTLLSAEGFFDPQVHTIYAPDSTGRLARSITCTYDDLPWLSGPEISSTRIGCRFIHPNISSQVATKLGVVSLRLTLLSRNLEQNFFSTPGTKSEISAFGQAESLTSRLKSILDLYPEGKSTKYI